MRHLFTLALGGFLGVCLLASDAEACHKQKCGGGCAPVVCYQPPLPQARPLAKPVKTCGFHAKKSCCGGGLFHKRGCGTTCATPVACNTGYVSGGYSYAAPVPSGQTYAAPQTYSTPQVPSKR